MLYFLRFSRLALEDFWWDGRRFEWHYHSRIPGMIPACLPACLACPPSSFASQQTQEGRRKRSDLFDFLFSARARVRPAAGKWRRTYWQRVTFSFLFAFFPHFPTALPPQSLSGFCIRPSQIQSVRPSAASSSFIAEIPEMTLQMCQCRPFVFFSILYLGFAYLFIFSSRVAGHGESFSLPFDGLSMERTRKAEMRENNAGLDCCWRCEARQDHSKNNERK